jgi:hypothetical protein
MISHKEHKGHDGPEKDFDSAIFVSVVNVVR